MPVKSVTCLAAVAALLICARAGAADLHPIVEIETGYFFGASAKDKWIKAGQAAKSVTSQTTYRVDSLTEQVGQTEGSKPKSVEEICPDTLTVSLSRKPKGGVIGLAAPWNALTRKPQVIDPTQQVYVDAVRDFLKARNQRTESANQAHSPCRS